MEASFFESPYFRSNRLLAACDEVGRGPLAGPVVGVCVGVCFSTLDECQCFLKLLDCCGVRDSKKLTSQKRKKILTQLQIDLLGLDKSFVLKLKHYPCYIGLGQRDWSHIDEHNILQSSLKAMSTGLELVIKHSKSSLEMAFIDGPYRIGLVPEKECPLIKGDSKSLLIGLASIIAKEYRDDLMKSYDDQYPGYGFAKNCGYPTQQHKLALAKLGATPIHRMTFKGVSGLCEN